MSLKDFQVIQKLGEGAYSSVYKVKRHSDGQEYALKKVKMQNLSDKEKQNALNEVRILASIRSNHIVGYKEAFLDEASNSLCIIMEYANNGDLFQKIVDHQKKGQLFPEQEIWNILIQMVKGIKALHDLKIFHRDLKSANIFLNKDGTVKLGDMNVSKVAKKGLLYTQTGTPYYARITISPEVWKDQPYDAKSDIWSLGCVLYEMITLKPPFRAEDMEGLYKKVIRGYYPRIPPHFSQDLANVVRGLLQVAPHLRPSPDKILQLPSMVKRVNDSHLLEVDEGVPFLLTTIRVPKNLHYLTDKLPKPNYSPLKVKKIEKQRFMQTLAGYKGDRNLEDEDEDGTMGSNGIQQARQVLLLPKINSKGGEKTGSAGIQKEDSLNSHNNSVIMNNDSYIQNISNLQSSPLRENSEGNSLNQSIVTDHPSVKKKSKRKLELEMINNSNNNGNMNINGHIISQQQSPYNADSNGKVKNIEIKRKIDLLERSPDIIKQIKYDQSPGHKVGLGQGKRLHQGSLVHLQKRQQENINLLDIEGESKPLIKKNKRDGNPQSPNKFDDSLLLAGSDENNRLPAIGIIKLPRVIGVSNSQLGGNSLSPRHNNQKENQKLKDISKAYKVNINQLEEIKDRYRSLKRVDQPKSKQYIGKNLPNSVLLENSQKYKNSPLPEILSISAVKGKS